MTSPSIDTAPDYIEPLEAWRVWHAVEQRDAIVLRSVVKRVVWPTGEPLVASCLRSRPFLRFRKRPPHDVPAEDCECGIYATSLDRLGPYVSELPADDALARVVGRVALWGTVVECERGYRASEAYPVELFLPWQERHAPGIERPRLAAALGRAYGVPCVAVDRDVAASAVAARSSH